MADIWMDVDAALSEVPVNLLPLLDDTDFKSRETGVAYNASGMDLVWNFVTSAGAYTQTAVTPTTSGNYDWTHQGDGMYSIEIPASGGASINNDTEGFGWFTGMATGVLPWRGPVIGFRAAALNDALIEGGSSLTVIAGSLGSTAKSDVNAEVVDALATDTYAEPSAAPSATSSLKDKVGWLFILARNKILQTSTTSTLRNDADSGDVATSTGLRQRDDRDSERMELVR